ncbi:MAG: Cys-tRNA(Pro) deacylase [Ndongobacter sp.]|nr:Cys-tRNA(Pro) deacylase [Ndongobacter sp.]
MKKNSIKTNAVRLLDKEKVPYELLEYEHGAEAVDGVTVAERIGRDPKTVFKTLVTMGKSGGLYVFEIPVAENLDLKKAAKLCCEKSVEMIPVKDITKWTGYVRGGCSPLGMKKNYPTYWDATSEACTTLVVSAGKIGHQISAAAQDLIRLTNGTVGDLLLK